MYSHGCLVLATQSQFEAVMSRSRLSTGVTLTTAFTATQRSSFSHLAAWSHSQKLCRNTGGRCLQLQLQLHAHAGRLQPFGIQRRDAFGRLLMKNLLLPAGVSRLSLANATETLLKSGRPGALTGKCTSTSCIYGPINLQEKRFESTASLAP